MSIRSRARAWLEKKLERFYEGPRPPNRYGVEARAFAKLHPNADPDAWAEVVEAIAADAYRDGYVRGFEWRERDLEAANERMKLEEAERNAWERGPEQLEGIDDPLDGLSPEQREILLHQLGHVGATFVK